LHFGVADALSLPFPSGSFDVVCAYQFLEHSPKPEQTLAEFLRVLKPGGVVCVVGPNLVALSPIVQGLLGSVWKTRPIKRILIREAGMPRHPYGNTVFEVLANIPILMMRILTKLVRKQAKFTMREPDLTPPFHADNDACYLCNPIDLTRYFVAQGCTILRNGKPGRLRGTALLAGGTWLAASKPRSS
jgi:SAM-dependent methyltransferase